MTAELITIEPCGEVPAIVSTKVIYSTTMKKLSWIIQPLTAIAFCMLATLNILLYLIWYQPDQQSIEHQQQQLGNSLVRHLALDATAPLYAKDRALLSNLLNRFADDPFVISARVHGDGQNALLLSSRTKAENAQDADNFEFPIHFGNELLGTAYLLLSRNEMHQWQAQRASSWVLFNLLAAAALIGFIYWRHHSSEHHWQQLYDRVHHQLPKTDDKLTGNAEQKMTQLMNWLIQPRTRQEALIKKIQTQLADNDTERLIEQVALVSSQGEYKEIALVSIQCQNWDDLIRHYSATELQALWSQYETMMMRVSELYSGIVLPDGFTLVFGLGEEEDCVFSSLCAARVLQLALQILADNSASLSPVFGFVISAGPAFVSKTQKHGIPLPLVTGDAEVWLSQLKALQPMNQILLAEPVLQDNHANSMIEASLLRDMTLRNGQRLEVWELDSFKINDDLLHSQAHTLTATIGH